MKVNELKVGDRVKYYYPVGIITDTTIGEGIINQVVPLTTPLRMPSKDILFYIKPESGPGGLYINGKDIISKIEKQENIKCDICKEEIKFAEPKNVFHVCDGCCEKEKNPPKSFKFDIVVDKWTIEYNKYCTLYSGTNPEITVCGRSKFLEKDGGFTFENLPFSVDFDWDVSKEYTVEIKEKK